MRAEMVLVRHAQSVFPTPGGPDDHHRALTPVGLRQAENLVAELVRVKPRSVASSPYLRAVQTVEPVARALGLPVETSHALREWDSGLTPTPDYVRHYAASWADPAFARPGGESLDELTHRATTALTALARRPGTVVVGSHGTFVSRALAGFGVTAVDWNFHRAMPMPAVYRIRFGEGGVQVSGPGL